MKSSETFFDRVYNTLLSEGTKQKSERVIIIVAIISFIIHLILILLTRAGLIGGINPAGILTNPVAAIYTPFSFILLYEVYLLVYYLPKSISNYISKQYEILTLIVIRRIFKDLSNLELSGDWLNVKYNLQFSYDIITTLLLFFLIFLFYGLLSRCHKSNDKQAGFSPSLQKFIKRKKILASALVPVFLILAAYSFGDWLFNSIFSFDQMMGSIQNVNHIFFTDFFTVLILTDVLLLLFSFFNTDIFHKIIRNSGFIISTILIRLSFSAEGLINNVLIITAVLFGVLILMLYYKFEKLNLPENS